MWEPLPGRAGLPRFWVILCGLEPFDTQALELMGREDPLGTPPPVTVTPQWVGTNLELRTPLTSSTPSISWGALSNPHFLLTKPGAVSSLPLHLPHPPSHSLGLDHVWARQTFSSHLHLAGAAPREHCAHFACCLPPSPRPALLSPLWGWGRGRLDYTWSFGKRTPPSATPTSPLGWWPESEGQRGEGAGHQGKKIRNLLKTTAKSPASRHCQSLQGRGGGMCVWLGGW